MSYVPSQNVLQSLAQLKLKHHNDQHVSRHKANKECARHLPDIETNAMTENSFLCSHLHR
jgi:hypothetical protein